MRKNVVQRSKNLLGQGDLLWEARRAYVDEKLHKLTTRKGGRAVVQRRASLRGQDRLIM